MEYMSIDKLFLGDLERRIESELLKDREGKKDKFAGYG
jgi:hypothetical protein